MKSKLHFGDHVAVLNVFFYQTGGSSCGWLHESQNLKGLRYFCIGFTRSTEHDPGHKGDTNACVGFFREIAVSCWPM
jgi:hypothetical protein